MLTLIAARLKAWEQKFRGVAKSYLANYLGCFRALDREKGNGPKLQQWLAMAIGETVLQHELRRQPY